MTAPADALPATSVTPARVEQLPRGITIAALDSEADGWRMLRDLADHALTQPDDCPRWATLEAYDDRRSSGTWRLIIGCEERSGKGR